LALAGGNADTLEYRDARRGLLKRVAWRGAAPTSHFDGLLLAGAQRDAGGEALLEHALSGEAWHGARLAAFAQAGGAVRDPVVCQCTQVRESAIRAEAARGAAPAEIRTRLGCGSVCGSCMPQVLRLCATVASA
ncbi:(2Fe-2S)-binding protein, partial [Xanthomonas graminis]